MKTRFLCSNVSCLLGLAGLAVGLVGCGSGPQPHHRPAGDALMAPRELPSLYEGSAEFCAGSIKAVVTLSKGFGGMRGGSGGGGNGGGGHGHHSGGKHGGGSGAQEEFDEQSPRRVGESSLPPVMIHLRFENSSDSPVVLGVWDFKSDLGDFAVRPDRITVPARGSAKVESMTSHQGLASGELPVTLRLRSASGEETRVIRVVRISEPAQPPPAS